MTDHNDPLWNPRCPPDPELARLEQALGSFSVRARRLEHYRGVLPRRRVPRWGWALAAALAAVAILSGAHWYRLQWPDGAAWVVHQRGDAVERMRPGDVVQTGSNDTLQIEVARIGHIMLSENSSLTLIKTSSGAHRVQLQQGHMRARIWAPPGLFGVRSGAAEVVDLGCEFELWQGLDGSGRARVYSGWIAYRLGDQDVLVPAGFALDFNALGAQTPLRQTAGPALREAVTALDISLKSSGPTSQATVQAAQLLADRSSDADGYTLLSLLSRHPALAASALYPRLAQALGAKPTDRHRADWSRGDQAAMNAWWNLLPVQPKNWWANWRDGWL